MLCKMALKLLKPILKKICKVHIHSKRLYNTQRRSYCVLIVCIITLASTAFIFTSSSDNNKNILSLNETYRLIQNRLKENVLQEKGMGCQIPQINPFSVEAMQYVEDLPKITCKGGDWVVCNRSKCYVKEKILKYITGVSCAYRDIVYVNDKEYFLSDNTVVRGGEKYMLNKSDHVKVFCTGRELNSYNILASRWYGIKAGLRPVETKPIPPDRKDSYNVMILAFNSASHCGFIRKMPKSYKYLSHRGTILNNHNIVGESTPAALYPIFTGKPEEELPDARKKMMKKVYIDHKRFIFHQLKEYGYRTAYFEENTKTGTFQRRFNGFRHQPADHYLRALELERQKAFHNDYSANYCIGDTPQYQLLLDLTAELLESKGKKFSFTFISDICHDNFNQIATADEAVLSFLETLAARRVFEDTLVIVMGDHGDRYTKFRQTYQGKLEERLPFIAIILPEKLKRLRPNAFMALRHNKDILTTYFDVHTTLLDVLDLKNKSNKYRIPGSDLPRAMSLLEPIPKTRTCAEAGIVQHWCACTKWFNVSQLAPMYRQAANALAAYIDSISEKQRSLCERRALLSIESVLQQNVNNHLLTYAYENEEDSFLGNSKCVAPRPLKEYYQAKIILSPGRGVFEGTMIYDTLIDIFTITPHDVSRISAYGDESRCISMTHPQLTPFCYCKDYLRKHATKTPTKDIGTVTNKRFQNK